jgi:serine/threonine protein kinase/tetratricopeptide (TPR) repeat protein
MTRGPPNRLPFPEGLDAACSELLSASNRMALDGRARVVVIHGVEGSGKSQVVRWLAGFVARQERSAFILAHHSVTPSISDGIGSALAEQLGAPSWESSDALATALIDRCVSLNICAADEAGDLAATIWPRAGHQHVPRLERNTLHVRLLRKIAAERSVVLVLEDVQWSEAAVSLVVQLIQAQSERATPILVVLTLRTDAQDPDEHEISRPPLTLEHVRELLRPVGGAAELALTARPGPTRGPMIVALDAAMDRAVEDDQRLVERLAFLGMRCSGAEWTALRPRVTPSGEALLGRLEQAGIVEPWRGGWAFTTERLWRRMLARAAQAGRARSHHAACAEGLRARYGASLAAERLAWHLLASDQPEEAMAALAEAAQRRWIGGAYSSWERLIHVQERLADRIGLAVDHPHRVELLNQRSRLARLRSRLDEGLRLAERALQLELASGRPEDRGLIQTLKSLAQIYMELAELDRAEAMLQRCVNIAEQLGEHELRVYIMAELATVAERRGDSAKMEEILRKVQEIGNALAEPHIISSTAWRLAQCLRSRGQNDEAIEVYASAEAAAASVGHRFVQATSLLGRGAIFLSQGRLGEAELALNQGLELMERMGNRVGEAHFLNALAEISRQRGELRTAEQQYRRAITVLDEVGSGDALLPRMNLGLVLLGRGLTRQAKELFEQVAAEAEERVRRAVLCCVLTFLLPCCAAEREWEQWESVYQRAAALLEGTRLIDRDLAWAAELSGEWCHAAARDVRELSRAARSLEIAAAQLVGLVDDDGLNRVNDRLIELAREGSPIPLGPFDLERQRGEGGSGAVWTGWHRQEGVQIAVKVLTAEGARRPEVLESFRQEVRSVASLDHPNIVLVLENGRVSEIAERMSEGRLVSGSPYLAMEYCRGGSLSPVCGRLEWSACRTVLVSLLDALAHAHARGVTHRDVKPANVLLERAHDPSSGIKLSDFGIAHALREGPIQGRAAGTPEYMAPEQFSSDLRQHGPWTDLYALGCLAVTLVSGRPPFQGDSLEALRRAHWLLDPPPLAPRMAVPAGLERWITRLLRKRAEERFTCAADAAWALTQLGDPDFATFVPPADDVHSLIGGETEAHTFFLDDVERGSSPQSPSAPQGVAVEPMPIIVPPAPVDWRRRGPRGAPPLVRTVGLGLFGLRPIPLLGREAERDGLWSSLLTVVAQGGVRCVLLSGPSGFGKSRLAGWLAERAYTLGQASLLRVEHKQGDERAFADALARRLRVQALSDIEQRRRLAEWIRAQELDGKLSASLLTEALNGERTPFHDHALLTATVHLSVVRPVVIALDEVQWGATSLHLIRPLLEGSVTGPCGVVIVMTANDEDLAESPEAAQGVEALRARGLIEEQRVGPLPVDVRFELVHSLLNLEDALSAEVARRSAGNPAFAIELVGEWAKRDYLRAGEGGYHLRHGAADALPNHIHARWSARMDRLQARRGEPVRLALEVAAVMGEIHVERLDWVEACAFAELELPPRIDELLLEEAVIERRAGGFVFVHAMLRECLEIDAERAHRAARWRRACAAMLQARGREQDRARVAVLRMRAGEPEQAIEPVREAVEAHLRAGRPDEAAGLMELWEDALRSVGAADDDPRWGLLWLARAEVGIDRGFIQEITRYSQKIVEYARRYGWRVHLPWGLYLRGRALLDTGAWEDAWSAFTDARELLRDRHDIDGVARCTKQLGRVARAMGRLEEAEEYFQEAGVLAESVGSWRTVGRVRLDLGSLAVSRQRYDVAESFYQDGLSSFRRVGYLLGEAECLNNLGELHRYQGRLDLAEMTYRRAISLYSRLSSSKVLVPQLNLGQVLLGRDRFEEAQRHFEHIAPDVERRGGHALRFFLDGFRLAAMHPDDPEWEALYRRVHRAVESSEIAEQDIAFPMELAAERAQKLRRPDKARALYTLARTQWERLGVPEAVRRLTEAEETLGSWMTGV